MVLKKPLVLASKDREKETSPTPFPLGSRNLTYTMLSILSNENTDNKDLLTIQ